MSIRLFRPADSTALTAIRNALSPDQPFITGHHTWVIEEKGKVAGYTAVSPVPGLDGVFSLEGAIAPHQQRQELGSRLLAMALREAPSLGIRQLSHSVTNLDSPGAHFLRRHNFFIEHEEWLMSLPDLTHLPTAVVPTSCRLKTYRMRPQAIRTFRKLYDQSFGGAPWYQPYSVAEAAGALESSTDILFLLKANNPIGFAWLRSAKAEIEPIGVVKGEQGKGYGRYLLLAALHLLQQQGAVQSRIGVWRENHTAVHLYQSIGFQHRQTLVYLAYNMR